MKKPAFLWFWATVSITLGVFSPYVASSSESARSSAKQSAGPVASQPPGQTLPSQLPRQGSPPNVQADSQRSGAAGRTKMASMTSAVEVINSLDGACKLLRQFVDSHNFPRSVSFLHMADFVGLGMQLSASSGCGLREYARALRVFASICYAIDHCMVTNGNWAAMTQSPAFQPPVAAAPVRYPHPPLTSNVVGMNPAAFMGMRRFQHSMAAGAARTPGGDPGFGTGSGSATTVSPVAGDTTDSSD